MTVLLSDFVSLCLKKNMTKIGLISDTHGFLDERVFDFFKDCDEVWHGGDFGEGIIERFKSFKTFKGVFGNIDDQKIRHEFPEQLVFNCEKVKVMIRHIGGSPPNYNAETRKELSVHKPQLLPLHWTRLRATESHKLLQLQQNRGFRSDRQRSAGSRNGYPEALLPYRAAYCA